MSGKGSIFDQLRALFGGKPQAPPVPTTKLPPAQPPPQQTPPAKQPSTQQSPPSEARQPWPPQPPPSVPRTNHPPQQHPLPAAPSPPSRPGVDLVLGIDFGTSCTKVVIGDPGWRAKSYPVPLVPNAQGLARFLKPSRMTLVTSEGAEVVEGNLKMRLMDHPEDPWVRLLATLYLAGVIRDSMAWFEASLGKAYATRQLVWSLNLGFPAKAVGRATPLARAYRKVAEVAALLGSSKLPLTSTSIHELESAGVQADCRAAIPPDRVEFYPEIAAQLAGYVNSPYRVQGNLLLIDVGAGTLDVSTIILHGQNDEDIVSFHFCEVESYGAFKLLEHRVEAIARINPGSVRQDLGGFQDGTAALPEDLGQLVRHGFLRQSDCSEALKSAFSDASERFAKESVRVALSCLARFHKRQRDVHANPGFEPWPGQLRFFFTGGGSRSAFYQEHFAGGHLENNLVRFTHWHHDARQRVRNCQGLRLESLPLPNDLEGFPESLKSDFDRLSVAHGLAYGGDNLMRVTASTCS